MSFEFQNHIDSKNAIAAPLVIRKRTLFFYTHLEDSSPVY